MVNCHGPTHAHETSISSGSLWDNYTCEFSVKFVGFCAQDSRTYLRCSMTVYRIHRRVGFRSHIAERFLRVLYHWLSLSKRHKIKRHSRSRHWIKHERNVVTQDLHSMTPPKAIIVNSATTVIASTAPLSSRVNARRTHAISSVCLP